MKSKILDLTVKMPSFWALIGIILIVSTHNETFHKMIFWAVIFYMIINILVGFVIHSKRKR